jgi:replicative DNA helicase
MQPYTLQTEFADPAAEQALIASIAQQPSLYWELFDLLTADVFVHEAPTWEQLARAMEAGQGLTMPTSWQPAADPHTTARHLLDLSQRRMLAGVQERLAKTLYDEVTPAAEIIALLGEEALQLQAALRKSAAGQLQWVWALVPQVLEAAEARRRHREQTGTTVLGVPTGLPQLDTLLNGLGDGLLHLLGGPPGMGKTTLALQIATAAAHTIPVVFVTFEDSAANLTLKALCANVGVKLQAVQRGTADLQPLRTAAATWHAVAQRLALIDGHSQLTVAQVRAQALHAMHQHQSERCLVIVDYLQCWAKLAKEFRSVSLVRERVEMLGGALRELATQLQSPLLALSSQNRAQGHYGNGKGAAALDSLKESGDLEYAADVVLFLTAADPAERHATLPARAVDLTIAKNRHGETGTVALIFRPDIGTLREEARS